jgi:5-methylcytosine-specific restriction protein A
MVGAMPTRAPSRCTAPLCGAIAVLKGRCHTHQRPAWEGRPSSTARYGISGSAQQTLHQSILERDGRICYVCHLPGADTVDHVIPIWKGGAKVDPSNLAAIHADPCHAEKTIAENRERSALRAAARLAKQ